MRALVTLFGLGLVACSSATPASAPQPALAGTRAPSPPTGPAPRIAFRDGTFDTSQLPAIARSGELAVVAAVDGDGGRGYPNLRLEVRDRRDRIVESQLVLVSNDFETLVPDALHAGPELERRVAVANTKLAALHADHDLVAMRTAEGLAVTFDNARLRVRKDGKLLADVDGTSWLAPSGKRCPQCEPCENPAYLAGVHKADGIDAVVVRIAYKGTDTCWEPGDQQHVVAW
jgi:hypothetical protein